MPVVILNFLHQLVVQLWLIPAGSCLGVSSKMSAQRILLKKILTCTVAELDWHHCDDGCLVLGPFRVDFFMFLCCSFLSLLFCLSSSVAGCVFLPSASRRLGTIPCTVVIDSSQCELLNVYYLQTFCYCSPVVFTVSGTLILWSGWWWVTCDVIMWSAVQCAEFQVLLFENGSSGRVAVRCCLGQYLFACWWMTLPYLGVVI